MRLIVALAIAAGLALPVAAQQRIAVASIDRHLQLVSADGRVLRLAGIEPIAQPQVRAALGRHRAIEWAGSGPAVYDRWGAELAAPSAGGALSLPAMLVRDGLALVRPDTALAGQLDQLFALERAARAAGRGLWAGPQRWPVTPEETAPLEGRFALVRGRVLQAQATRGYTYLNFGAVWRTDFTVRVPAPEAGKMAKQGLDLVSLADHWIEVRGHLFEENGPMIEIRHREALEIVE